MSTNGNNQPRGAFSQLLDAKTLSKISHLRMEVSTRVSGAIIGRHRSPTHGSSIEFAEHKEYTPGDEIRHMDWKAYGRFDKYYIKRFEDETNLRTFLLVDGSGSMGYQSGGVTKLQYACQLAAALSFILLRQQDSVGLVAFSDRVTEFVPPLSRSSHLEDISRVLCSLSPQGQTHLVQGLTHVLERARRRSLIIILSDFFDPSPDMENLLAQMARRNDVALIHVMDPYEISFPFENLTIFRSMEGAGEVLAEPKVMRETYLRELKRFRESLKQIAVKNGIAYQLASTDLPLDQVLVSYITARSGQDHRGASV